MRLASTASVIAGLAVWMVLAAGGRAEAVQAMAWSPAEGSAPDTVEVTVYKNASCGCCTKWVEHIREHGFTVVVHDTQELDVVKRTYEVPAELRSCHTAIVGGYVVEGHVPADLIQRLLDEQPAIAGIGVPGMPIGSPGMEMEGVPPRSYEVLAWTEDGATSVFATR